MVAGMSQIGDNSGMLDPELAAESMRRALGPWDARRAEFEAKANRAVVETAEAAQNAIDFVRKARALVERAKLLRDEVQEPYADCARSAGAVATTFIENVESSIRKVRTALENYNAVRRQRAADVAEEQRKAEAALAAQAAARDGAPAPQIPQGARRSRRVSAPIRTDTGGLMVEVERDTYEVEDVTLIPAFVLNSPKVKEAIRIVAGDFIKNGMEVPGIRVGKAVSPIIK